MLQGNSIVDGYFNGHNPFTAFRCKCCDEYTDIDEIYQGLCDDCVKRIVHDAAYIPDMRKKYLRENPTSFRDWLVANTTAEDFLDIYFNGERAEDIEVDFCLESELFTPFVLEEDPE